MAEDIEDLVEQAEKDDEGLTNDVYFTDNEVIKIYSQFPLTSFLLSATTILSGPEYYSRKKRMDTEKKSLNFFEKCEFKAPQIIEVQEDTIVFQKVEGESGFEYLNQASDEEAISLGKRFRDFFGSIHSQGFALRDARLTNFLILDNHVYSIDHEYADTNSNFVTEFLDRLTLISSARQTKNYREFRKGFSPGLPVRLLSIFTALGHATVLERSTNRVINLIKGGY